MRIGRWATACKRCRVVTYEWGAEEVRPATQARPLEVMLEQGFVHAVWQAMCTEPYAVQRGHRPRSCIAGTLPQAAREEPRDGSPGSLAGSSAGGTGGRES